MIFLLYTGTSALIIYIYIYISNIQGTKKYSAVMYYYKGGGHPPSTEGRGVSPPPQMQSVFQQLARSLPAEAEDLAPVAEGCYGDAMDRPIVQ